MHGRSGRGHPPGVNAPGEGFLKWQRACGRRLEHDGRGRLSPPVRSPSVARHWQRRDGRQGRHAQPPGASHRERFGEEAVQLLRIGGGTSRCERACGIAAAHRGSVRAPLVVALEVRAVERVEHGGRFRRQSDSVTNNTVLVSTVTLSAFRRRRRETWRARHTTTRGGPILPGTLQHSYSYSVQHPPVAEYPHTRS